MSVFDDGHDEFVSLYSSFMHAMLCYALCYGMLWYGMLYAMLYALCYAMLCFMLWNGTGCRNAAMVAPLLLSNGPARWKAAAHGCGTSLICLFYAIARIF